jgi:RNA polymerase sigma-70 factor (ECF subfamily)
MGFGPADADDILQDVRIKALDSPGAYRGEEEARRWLLRVTTNRCIVEFRQRRRFQRIAADIIARRQAEGRPGGGPEAEAMRAEDVERVRAGLAELDEGLLAPLVLKYFNGLTSQQIGEILDLPPGTVRSRLHEGRLMLAGRLMEGERR